MSEAISMEARFFLVSVFYGVLILILYDILRILRRIVKHTRLIVSIEDIIFWVVNSVLIFQMMYQQNNGTIRGFAIMGMILGMFVYNQSLSKPVVKGTSKIINKIIELIFKLIQFLTAPVRFVFNHMKRLFRFLESKVKKVIKYIIKGLKKIMKTVKITVTKD